MKFFNKKQERPKKIGLALGSGSARGWAHIGVIDALSESGITVDYIAGTSVGAVVGAIYASGGIDSFEETILQFDWKKIVAFLDIVFPKSGLIDGNRIAGFIRSHVGEKNIEDLSLPFRAVCTDLSTGSEVSFQNGDIIEAVRASISMPGVFTPVKKKDMILVDGGLVNPVPVSVVREMGADYVIAVDLNHDIIGAKGINKASVLNLGDLSGDRVKSPFFTKRKRMLDALDKRFQALSLPPLTHIRQWVARDSLPNIFEIIISSINIMETQITSAKLTADPPDLLIQPSLGHLRFLEFHRAKEAIFEGYKATKLSLDSPLLKHAS